MISGDGMADKANISQNTEAFKKGRLESIPNPVSFY